MTVLGPSLRPTPWLSAENWWRVRLEDGRVLDLPSRNVPKRLRHGR